MAATVDGARRRRSASTVVANGVLEERRRWSATTFGDGGRGDERDVRRTPTVLNGLRASY
jgi:hypothetical protein